MISSLSQPLRTARRRCVSDSAQRCCADAYSHQATVAPDHTALSPEAAEAISCDQRLKLALQWIVRGEGLLRPLLAEQGVPNLDALVKIFSHYCLAAAHAGRKRRAGRSSRSWSRSLGSRQAARALACGAGGRPCRARFGRGHGCSRSAGELDLAARVGVCFADSPPAALPRLRRPAEGEEGGVALEGAIIIEVDGKVYQLSAGDSFRFNSGRAHSFRNAEKEPARVIWVNAHVSRAD